MPLRIYEMKPARLLQFVKVLNPKKLGKVSMPNGKVFQVLLFIGGFFAFLFMARLVQVAAFVPNEINFQGKITDINGVNVANNYYDFRVRTYSVVTGGTVIETFDLADTYVENGVFNIKFAPGNTSLANADTYFLI